MDPSLGFLEVVLTPAQMGKSLHNAPGKRKSTIISDIFVFQYNFGFPHVRFAAETSPSIV
jgi:hypothetical protein